MEFEFDKEMDAILRKARGAEVATSPASAHLDADEFAAFADNAVSDAMRARFTAHLADCTRCRKILSNVVLLNSEAETETASSVVSAPVAETKTPWYRRLFVFPQLAYTMGAMVLVLSGFFGYLMLKNLSGTQSSDVSFSTKPAADETIAPSNAQSAANANTAANSSAPSMPSAVSNSTTTTTANSAPFSSENSPANSAPAQTDKRAAVPELNSPVVAPQATPPPENKSAENSFVVDGQEVGKLAKPTPASPTAGATAQTTSPKEEKQKKDTADVFRDDDESNNEQKVMRSEPDSKRKALPAPKASVSGRSNAGETRSVGGKTFNNVGGIWFDSAVGKQKQKTVRRGTNDYQKLDSGLRSIADQLGGTIVILWSGKAYRIE